MPLFTRENAATASAKGNAVRWSRWRAERAKQAAAAIAPPPQPIIPEPDNSFAGRRLTRVREQLERLDRLAAEEDDPKQLKALADATTRLSEQERLLAGRPLPGSRRPSADPKGRKSDWWIEMQPSAPAQVPERLPGDVTP